MKIKRIKNNKMKVPKCYIEDIYKISENIESYNIVELFASYRKLFYIRDILKQYNITRMDNDYDNLIDTLIKIEVIISTKFYKCIEMERGTKYGL